MVLELARAMDIEVVERPFTVAEAREAREAFLTSTSSLVLPVTTIDGRTVANGMPGSITTRLLEAYREHLSLRAGDTSAPPMVVLAASRQKDSLAVSLMRRYPHRYELRWRLCLGRGAWTCVRCRCRLDRAWVSKVCKEKNKDNQNGD